MAKIPEQAEKVFIGQLFTIYQRQQKMFDGSYTTFEMARREDSCEVFATYKDKLVMVYQKQPHRDDWYRWFPGWRVPIWEDIFTQAKKELLEETGMISDDWQEYEIFDIWWKIEQYVWYYIARNVRVVASQNLDPGGEIIEVKYVSFDDLIDMIVEWCVGSVYLMNHVLHMKIKGKLAAFRERIFGKI